MERSIFLSSLASSSDHFDSRVSVAWNIQSLNTQHVSSWTFSWFRLQRTGSPCPRAYADDKDFDGRRGGGGVCGVCVCFQTVLLGVPDLLGDI